MKKRPILFIAMLLALTSCKGKNQYVTDFSWEKYKSDGSIGYVSPRLEANKDLTFDETKLEGILANYKSALENNDFKALKKADKALGEYYELVVKTYKVAQVYFYAENDDSKKELKEKAYDVMLEIEKKINEYLPLAKTCNKNIREFMFDSNDDAEIDKQIKEAQDQTIIDEMYVELSNLQDDCEQAIENLDIDSKVFAETCAEYMVQEAELIWPVAEQFDLLPSELLAKEVYGRKYSKDDEKKVLKFVEDYVSSFFVYVQNYPKGFKADVYDCLSSQSAGYDGAILAGELLDEYINNVGGNMKSQYDNLWKTGAFYFSDNEDSLGTAYVDDGYEDLTIVFFGSDNQQIGTIVHEFGHYYAATKRYDSDVRESYDILETHSQGSEACFYNYIANNYNKPAYKVYADEGYMDLTASMIASSLLADVELYALDTKDVTKEQILTYASLANRRYNASGIFYPNYWGYSSVSTMYYISYVTSAVASCQFYTMDYAEAVSDYEEFVSDTRDVSEDTKWKDAGLKSPFEEDIYKDIRSKLAEFRTKYQ